jgi:hypothetical protein
VAEYALRNGGHHRLEHGELLNHLSMADGNNLHYLRQVTPHLQRTDYGLARLGTLGLQKGKPLNPFLALPLSFFPLLLGIDCRIGQAPGVHLRGITSLVRFPMGRGQICGTLSLHSQHPLLGLPPSQGGPGLRCLDDSRGALLHYSGLLSRSLSSTNHHRMGSLSISGNVSCPNHLLP